MTLGKRLLAEFIGTFWLVFGGCGSAVVAAVVMVPPSSFNLGIGFVGVAFAFGLTVMTMAYAIGHISGCHLNPAVSIGLCVARRFPARDVLPYIIVQVLGGLLAAAVLMIIMNGQGLGGDGNKISWGVDVRQPGEFATNGYGHYSPRRFSLESCALAETVLTFMFVFIILGSTDKRAPAGFAPLAIGLGLTLIHLIGIPITNLSVNPARSTGPALALFPAANGSIPEQVKQLWLFWTAPIVGAILAGIVYPAITHSGPLTVTGEPAGAVDRLPTSKE